MADSWDKLERAYRLVKARRKRNQKLTKQREQKRAQRRRKIARMVTAVVVLAALWWAVGGLFTPGAAWAFIGLLALGSWFSSRVSGIGIPFALSFFAALLLVTEFVLPGVVTDAFAPYVNGLAGLVGLEAPAVSNIDAVAVAILSVAAILVYWALSIRLGTTRSMKATTVAKRMETKAENLAETYLTFGRVLVIFGVSVTAIAIAQFAQVSGEIVGYLTNAPMAASNFITGITGYLALGGSSPVWVPEFVRSIGPAGFLALVVLLLIGAYGLKQEMD